MAFSFRKLPIVEQEPSKRERKLLVVDDEHAVGLIIGRIAQQSGWQAIHTTIFQDLAKIIERENVDVLMIDYNLSDPVSNGLTVLEGLRHQGLTIPVILITGSPEKIEPARAARLTALQILRKPLSIQELRQCLNEAKRHIRDGGPSEALPPQ